MENEKIAGCTSMLELADKIIGGYRLTREDNLKAFLTAPLEELKAGAGKLQAHFCGNHIDLCTIINARSGRCPENCRYCAQSAHHHTSCEVYSFLDKEEILEHAKANEAAGVNRFAIVTSGRALAGDEFEKSLDAFRTLLKQTTLGLCASHGILSQEQLHRLVEAGVTSYHHNIETSKRNFPNICTTHTYDDRIRTIKAAQAEGLCVCSGGIIGMGETWEDRLDMAISLKELGIESIPLNSLMPVPGTPLEHMERIKPEDIERTIAFFRFINPTANIRLGAGRLLLPKNGEYAFTQGASASITGDMLTTSGTTIADDMAMLDRLGLSNAEYGRGTAGSRSE